MGILFYIQNKNTPFCSPYRTLTFFLNIYSLFICILFKFLSIIDNNYTFCSYSTPSIIRISRKLNIYTKKVNI